MKKIKKIILLILILLFLFSQIFLTNPKITGFIVKQIQNTYSSNIPILTTTAKIATNGSLSKLQTFTYAILPLILIGLIVLVLIYLLIALIKRHKKITFEIVFLGLIIAILLIPFTNKTFYFTIFPLSIILSVIILILIIYHFIKTIEDKEIVKIKDIFIVKINNLKNEEKQLKKELQKEEVLLKELLEKQTPEKITLETKPIEAIKQEPVYTPQPIYQPIPQPVPVQQPKLPQISPQEIINKNILRFNKLLKYISIDISLNKLDLANKRYQELLLIYKLLIIKVNKENRFKLYADIEQIYQALRRAVEINYFRKKP